LGFSLSTVLVYSDEGVDQFGLSETLSTLREGLSPSLYEIRTIDAIELKKGNWTKTCSLLVIPGGRDIPYLAKLGKEGMAFIKDYVLNGGSYLGICAGAYFASGFVEFQKGGPLEVLGERHLQFFSGKAIGPAIDKDAFCYAAPLGARPARILYREQELSVYYNGGCYFSEGLNDPSIQVICRYLEVDGHPPAIISCKVGKGIAILSGVHFEFSPGSFGSSSSLIQKVISEILPHESKRVKLVGDLLKYLGLKINAY
jgi:glutamine amidotransferase-like uncharacterized protein